MAWATRPKLVLGFAMLILASALFVPSSAAAYTRCACTDWAHRNRPDLPLTLGNAHAWGARARANGFPVDGNPRVGDIVVFQPGVAGAHSRLGHVAFVVGVGGGKVHFTEFNGTCRVNSRSARITGGMAFIHYR